ncbi:MAG TPA: alcohol dehydrogenase catalytic domain-containing protein [Nitriliruptoraceae bacterium]|nr:alcohol dehydrogenase catalytic domain-containing protein [Nitriliruptoraceae bacterium]
MKAGVLHGTRDLRVEEVADPTPGPGDVLVAVAYNGLCGTDTSEYGRGQKMVPLAARHPGSGHVGPTILGHEFVGEVVDAGQDARHLVGQRIACGAGVSCGWCTWCQAGRTNLCEAYYTLGLSTHGGLAELVVAPAATCVRVPDDCSDDNAVLAQPLAVGLHAVRRAKPAPGSTVVLLGAGAIGSFVCVGLADLDVQVVAIDIDEARLASVQRLGADEVHVVGSDATSDDLRAFVPAGADVVFETSGAPGAAARAADLAVRGGRVVQVGMPSQPQELDLASLVLQEIDVRTTVAHVCDHDLPAALDLLTGRSLVDDLVGRVVALDDVVSDGLEPMLDGTAGGKVLVEVAHG